MPATVLFVSVNQTFNPAFTLADLEPWVARAWALTVAKAMTCDRVVAIYKGQPVGAWLLRGAYPTEETWPTKGGPRPRIGLSLGAPLPVLPAYGPPNAPVLRRGSATAVLTGIDPLGPERDESLAPAGDDGEELAD